MHGVKVARGSSANEANIGTRLDAMREHINGKHSEACAACAVRVCTATRVKAPALPVRHIC